MQRIYLIDYGAGNLTSVRKGFAAAGTELITPRNPRELVDAGGIVVPGVGHFETTAALDASWRDGIQAALDRGALLLGICLGLQWLFQGSEEAPGVPGLGALEGSCSRLPAGQKVPHVGWNAIDIIRPSSLLAGIPSGTQMYFAHSYAAPVTRDCAASTTHGMPFAAMVQKGHVFGVQFHPEKSGPAGIRILDNFVRLCRQTNTAVSDRRDTLPAGAPDRTPAPDPGSRTPDPG